MKKERQSKSKRRLSFGFYFIIFTSLILIISIVMSVLIFSFASTQLQSLPRALHFIIPILASFLLGGVMTAFVWQFVLSPINRMRSAMTEVAHGNLDVQIDENSRFDEIADISRAFNIMTKELRSTETIQTDFVSNVSHEFKTPLTAIEGYATMLCDELSDEERREYTDKILFNVRRMSELVNNILLLSKLDNQGIDCKKETFSLDEQIRQTIVLTEMKWAEKKLNFDVKLERINYFANEAFISQIWSNLIGNAIKFSPVGGKITLELKMWNGYIYFAVSDEGEGLKPDSIDHLFEKFYQSDTSHKQEGNGLGLSLVKKIVDLYGGKVEAMNLPKGCKFVVNLPVD